MSTEKTLVDHLGGPASTFFTTNDEQKRQFSFFSPYESATDFTLQATSIITAPLLGIAFSVYFTLEALWNLTKAIGKLLQRDPEAAGVQLVKAKESTIDALQALLFIIASPLLNLAAFFGNTISTIKDACTADSSAPAVHAR